MAALAIWDLPIIVRGECPTVVGVRIRTLSKLSFDMLDLGKLRASNYQKTQTAAATTTVKGITIMGWIYVTRIDILSTLACEDISHYCYCYLSPHNYNSRVRMSYGASNLRVHHVDEASTHYRSG